MSWLAMIQCFELNHQDAPQEISMGVMIPRIRSISCVESEEYRCDGVASRLYIGSP